MIEVSRFWRDPALPFVEARKVGDGRQVCYAAHSHESFSIGVITGGRSTYLNGDQRHEVAAGTTVLMNPGVVHTCNPIAGEPWSYLMLFVDWPWLQALGFTLPVQTLSTSAVLYQRLLQAFAELFDASVPDREARLATLFRELPALLQGSAQVAEVRNPRLEAAAAFIRAHRCDALRLEDICAACGLSRSYLIRAFGQHFGLTPTAICSTSACNWRGRGCAKGGLSPRWHKQPVSPTRRTCSAPSSSTWRQHRALPQCWRPRVHACIGQRLPPKAGPGRSQITR